MACNFILKESPAQVFSCEFREIFSTLFLMNTSVAAFKLYILFQKVAMRMLLRKKTSIIISARGMLIVEAEFRILIVY